MSSMKRELEKNIQVTEMPMDISYDGGKAERVTFGIVLNETMLDSAELYANDDNIFFYLTLKEYYKLCSGVRLSQEWELAK